MSNIGVSDFSYALMTEDDIVKGVKYDAFKKIPGINKIEIKPAANSAVNYGDNVGMEAATSLGEVSVTLDMVNLEKEDIAAMLGHKIDEDGVMTFSGEDEAPYVCCMFRGTKSDGSGRWVKLLKLKFEEMADNYDTKTDKISFQNPQLTAKAVARKFDKIWKRTLDETADNADKVTAFTATVEPAAKP